jgi:hypothetical protein
LHNAHIRADLEQRLVDAAQIAGAVIKQSNHVVNLATDEHSLQTSFRTSTN